MIQVKAIKLKEYLNLENKDEYNFIMLYSIKFSESKNIYGLPDFENWNFGFINDYSFLLQNRKLSIENQIELIQKLFDYFKIKIDLKELSLLDYCNLRNFVNDKIIEVLKIESEFLSRKLKQEEISSGINEKFKGLEPHIKLSMLAGGDILKFDAIEQMPWSICFNEMLYRCRTTEYTEKLNKIYFENK